MALCSSLSAAVAILREASLVRRSCCSRRSRRCRSSPSHTSSAFSSDHASNACRDRCRRTGCARRMHSSCRMRPADSPLTTSGAWRASGRRAGAEADASTSRTCRRRRAWGPSPRRCSASLRRSHASCARARAVWHARHRPSPPGRARPRRRRWPPGAVCGRSPQVQPGAGLCGSEAALVSGRRGAAWRGSWREAPAVLACRPPSRGSSLRETCRDMMRRAGFDDGLWRGCWRGTKTLGGNGRVRLGARRGGGRGRR